MKENRGGDVLFGGPDELFGTRFGEVRDASGPTKGEFVPPPDVSGEEV